MNTTTDISSLTMTNATLSPVEPPGAVQEAWHAAQYNMVSSAAFVVAPLIAYLFLCCSPNGSRPTGSFGKFMVALELVDAIPEAAIVADAAVAGSLTWTFVFSIFCLNLANTFATAIDFTATRSSRALHRLLFCSIFFSVGMLMYSISTTVYGSFRLAYSLGLRNWFHALFLAIGTAIGAALIVALMKFEERVHHKQGEADRQSDPMHMLESTRACVEKHILHEKQVLQALDEQKSQNIEYTMAVRASAAQRLETLEKITNTLNGATQLTRDFDSPITNDARRVVAELLTDELAASPAMPLLGYRGGQTQSVGGRLIRLLIMMLGIAIWCVLLTFLFGLLFAKLGDNAGQIGIYVDTVAEGLSGGSFLATVAGTMMPRIQQDAYRSGWSTIAYRIAGLTAFETGLLFACGLDLLLGGSSSAH